MADDITDVNVARIAFHADTVLTDMTISTIDIVELWKPLFTIRTMNENHVETHIAASDCPIRDDDVFRVPSIDPVRIDSRPLRV